MCTIIVTHVYESDGTLELRMKCFYTMFNFQYVGSANNCFYVHLLLLFTYYSVSCNNEKGVEQKKKCTIFTVKHCCFVSVSSGA